MDIVSNVVACGLCVWNRGVSLLVPDHQVDSQMATPSGDPRLALADAQLAQAEQAGPRTQPEGEICRARDCVSSVTLSHTSSSNSAPPLSSSGTTVSQILVLDTLKGLYEKTQHQTIKRGGFRRMIRIGTVSKLLITSYLFP